MYSVTINNVEYKLLSLYDVAEKILFNEYSEDGLYNNFNDFIDEVSDTITIFGMSYNASVVLQKVDRIAYDCIFNEYVDSCVLDIANDIENILNDNMDSEIVYDNFGKQYTIKCHERGE